MTIEAVPANEAQVLAFKQAQANKRNDAHNGHGGSVELVRGIEINPEPVDWIWEGYLARGKLHMLAGAPGAGKTTLMMALSSTITIAGRWPDSTRAQAGSVLIWSGEDDISDTLVPRLIAAGADMSRIYFVGASMDAQGNKAPFDPAHDIPELYAAIANITDLTLMVVDPVVSAVSGDSNKAAETRRALQPLVDLAQKAKCALVGISHFSKGTAGRDPVERVTGSVTFGALPRIVLAAAKCPDDQGGGRMLVRSKSNIGPDGGGFMYDFDQIELAKHPGLFATRVMWKEPLEGSARELLATTEVVEDDGERGSSKEASEVLTDTLKDDKEGFWKAREATGKLRDAGYSEKQIRSAREKAGVIPKRAGFGKGSTMYWILPEQLPKWLESNPGTPLVGAQTDASEPAILAQNPIDAHFESGASKAGMGKYGADGDMPTAPEPDKPTRTI